MAHSANTFRDHAATYESMKYYVTDMRALQILDDLAAKNVARAEEHEALAVPGPSVGLSLALAAKTNEDSSAGFLGRPSKVTRELSQEEWRDRSLWHRKPSAGD